MNALIIVAAVIGVYLLVAAMLYWRDLHSRRGDEAVYAANRRRALRRGRSLAR